MRNKTLGKQIKEEEALGPWTARIYLHPVPKGKAAGPLPEINTEARGGLGVTGPPDACMDHLGHITNKTVGGQPFNRLGGMLDLVVCEKRHSLGEEICPTPADSGPHSGAGSTKH